MNKGIGIRERYKYLVKYNIFCVKQIFISKRHDTK